jgi:hypothetical protein
MPGMASSAGDRGRRPASVKIWAVGKPFLVHWLPLLLWMGVIFLLSAQPNLPHAPEGWLDTLLKKVGHMAEYVILAVLWQRALQRGIGTEKPGFFGETRFLTCGLLALALTLLYAISDEYHQSFVPGRHSRETDVFVDGLGAATGIVLFRWWRTK